MMNNGASGYLLKNATQEELIESAIELKLEQWRTEQIRECREKAMAEFGDLLFSLVNYARFINIDPEEALERTNKKLIKRFQDLEQESARDGKKMGEMTLEEMDVYWNRAKVL